MLAVAGALGSLSFVTHLEQIHFGPGAIPAWVPLALDAAIAGAAGLILTLGARLFDDTPAEPSGDYVVVAKSVWEGIQHEVVAARGGKPVTPPEATRPALVSEAAPAPALPPAPNPWDEGPPLSVGGTVAPALQSLGSGEPPRRCSGSWRRILFQNRPSGLARRLPLRGRRNAAAIR